MRCIDCPNIGGLDATKPITNQMGYCLSDSVPGTINPMAETQCKNHPVNKRQLSDKMFNNKLGVIKG